MLKITRSGKITSWSHGIQAIATGIFPGLAVGVNKTVASRHIAHLSVTFDCSICCVCKQQESHCPARDKNLRSTPLGVLQLAWKQ